MLPPWPVIALALGVLLAMLACLEAGYRLGRRAARRRPEWAHEGISALEAAVFGLLGLLLALSFAGGLSRLDARRQLIVAEANAIGTAYLRVDLLPTGDQPGMRRLFAAYLDSRLRAYDELPDLEAFDKALVVAKELQSRIWSAAVTGGRGDPSQNAVRILLPAINEMIDVTTARTVALHTHLPSLVFALMIFVALLSGLLGGYAMAKRRSRSWPHMLLFSLILTATIYIVIDLDYPSLGLIRLESAEQVLTELRRSIRLGG